jgi:tripartite-type tricarboxylate transporter receptor subunit TctC
LVALAKSAPEKVHYASSGNGSAQHLMGGLFVSLTGAPLKHVPYKGSNGAATDLVAGVVESSFAGVPNALAQVPQGRLRALAVTTGKRIPQLPDVPTMQEAGVPGYDASVWLALLAPAGTPRDIVDRLNAEIGKLMALARHAQGVPRCRRRSGAVDARGADRAHDAGAGALGQGGEGDRRRKETGAPKPPPPAPPPKPPPAGLRPA